MNTLTARAIPLLLTTLLCTACSKGDIPYFNYQDCQVKKRTELEQQGSLPPVADIKAKALCRELFNRD